MDALGVKKARQRLEEAGLTLPPVPAALAPAFHERAEWLFASRDVDPLAMYLFEQYPSEALTGPVDDYVALCHAGHGVNSYAVSYHLVHGRLALFTQTGWGGAYEDPVKSSAAVRQQLHLCAALVDAMEAAADRLPPAPARLVVLDSELRGLGGCGWLETAISEEQVPEWYDAHLGARRDGGILAALRLVQDRR